MTGPILVAYDFSPTADAALRWAAGLARVTGEPLVVVHVLFAAALPVDEFTPPPYPSDADLSRSSSELRESIERAGVHASCDVVVGPHIGQSLVSAADERGAGLMVMGTHGRGGITRAVLGSVADHVVRHANCPVVTLRATTRSSA
jgi:nucleotide-binding universal stress UspA family protein